MKVLTIYVDTYDVSLKTKHMILWLKWRKIDPLNAHSKLSILYAPC